jgi:methylthioribose-1-phosphate isomerase
MKPKQSPLFIPVLWEGSHFRILDETLLPWKIEYISVREAAGAVEIVREMKTRAFGQVLTFLYAAALTAQRFNGKEPEPLRERLSQLTEEFAGARPTFNFKGLGQSFSEWFQDLPAGQDVGSRIEAKAREMAARIIQAREDRARRTAEILPDPCRLLTHCNISGELVAVAQRCKEIGKDLSVIATETRPYLQGSRLTAWELAQAGTKVTLIPDNAIAQVMAKGEVDAALVGSDRCAQNGDVINKVGTYPLALMAKEYGLPFYALVQDSGSLAKGDDAPIEERPASELLTLQGRSLIPGQTDKITGRYPAFDVTPASLISLLIGLVGTFTPDSFRQKFQKTPTPPKKAKEKRGSYLLLYGIPKQNEYSLISSALKGEDVETVLLPEMRPELWGAHVVTPRLLEKKVPTTLISDNMMGTFFAQGQIQCLYLFYSALSEKGPVGICGSLCAALLARSHKVPIELFASEESRQAPPDRDVSTFMSQKVVPEGISLYPVEKELIPWSVFKAKEANIT